MHLAGIICELFPTEAIGTYFSPSKKGESPTGKLFSCYSNLRNALSSVGIIARETRKSSASAVRVETVVVRDDQLDIDDLLLLLEQEDIADKDSLTAAWAETAEHRDKLLESEISTRDYLHKFPVLKDQEGVELVGFE